VRSVMSMHRRAPKRPITLWQHVPVGVWWLSSFSAQILLRASWREGREIEILPISCQACIDSTGKNIPRACSPF